MNFDRNHNCNKDFLLQPRANWLYLDGSFLTLHCVRNVSAEVCFLVNFDCYSIKITATKDFLLQPKADGTRRKLAVS